MKVFLFLWEIAKDDYGWKSVNKEDHFIIKIVHRKCGKNRLKEG